MDLYSNAPYYLTAYGLAVKHGYRGTEQEFVDELMNGAARAAEAAQGSQEAAAESAEAAARSAGAAELDAQSAASDASDAEAYSAGTRSGTAVPETDPAYHNNAAYYAGVAEDYAEHIQDPVSGLVTSWLEDHITNPSNPPIDTSLSVSGAAADAMETGNVRAVGQLTAEAVYPAAYKANTATGLPTMNHMGIDLSTGRGLSGSSEFGKRCAITYEMLIPPSGICVTVDAGDEPWVWGVWCYSADTITAESFVYSPSNKHLLDAGQSVIVIPKDGAKYLRVQVRCKSTDPADASYGGYRPLEFEGETGVDVGAGDDLTIQTLISYHVQEVGDQTYNLVSPAMTYRAEANGIAYDGEVYSGLWSVYRKRWYWRDYQPPLPAGRYTITLDYKTGTAASGWVVIYYRTDESGTASVLAIPDRSEDWRHFSKTVDLPAGACIYMMFDSDLSEGDTSVLSFKNIQIVAGEKQTEYLPPTTAVDNIARNAANKDKLAFEASDNLFDLERAYSNSTGLTLSDDGVLQGTNTQFKKLCLMEDSGLGGKNVEITFENKRLTDAAGGKMGIVFLDSSDTVLSTVELITAPLTYWRSVLVTRTAPSGTVKIRFSEYGGASAKVFQVRKLRVRINSGSRTSDTGYEAIPATITAIDTVARGKISKTAGLHDGDLFRLAHTPEGVSRISYAQLIDLWDAFMTDYPDMVVKTQIAESTPPESDPSEVYPIYKYVFTPFARKDYGNDGNLTSSYVGYDRSVFLTAGCHGNEIEGYIGLLRLMRIIYDEGYRYPTLRKLRNHVRFVIIPSWNPYAVQHYQRLMADGTSPYSHFGEDDLPGEAAAIVDTLNLYDGQLSCWLDCHTNPFAGSDNPRPGVPKDQYKQGAYAFAPNSEMGSALYDLTCDFDNIFREEYGVQTGNNFTIVTPGSTGHPTYGLSRLPTAVLEICTKMKNFPEEQGSGGMMKLAIEWYGNCLAESIRAT